ncbi:hypothetical protein J4Q44_G00339750 [Coregonus suidteri]|uniref:Secreted protein n=1 Tax=Coregonus suidteri TaxID=861788 RepID=A0AAN8KRX2_9TELE
MMISLIIIIIIIIIMMITHKTTAYSRKGGWQLCTLKYVREKTPFRTIKKHTYIHTMGRQWADRHRERSFARGKGERGRVVMERGREG